MSRRPVVRRASAVGRRPHTVRGRAAAAVLAILFTAAVAAAAGYWLGTRGSHTPAEATRVAPAPDGSGKAAKGKQVEGFEMKETGGQQSGAASAPIPWLFMLGFAGVVGLVGFGFRRNR